MQLEQLPSKKWRAVVRHNGIKRSTKAFDLRSDAAIAGSELHIEMGGTPRPADLTVGEMVGRHLRDISERISPTTLADWRSVERRLPDSIKDRRVTSVNAMVVSSWWKLLKEAGWSPDRVKRAHTVLTGSFGAAQILGVIHVNPLSVVPPPTPKEADIVPPSSEAVRALLGAHGQLGILIRLAATTGARRGELVGIRWGHLDLERAELTIHKSLIVTALNGVEERDTKTGEKGHRNVTLDLPTVAKLRAHKRAQSESLLAIGESPTWVFSDDDGLSSWSPAWATTRWREWRDSIVARHPEVAAVRLHDLRHYTATTMLEDGVSLHDVAGQLGHASQTTTSRRYAKWLPGRNREAIDRIAARLDGAV